jgi:DNA-binding SARP family transcriptional activator
MTRLEIRLFGQISIQQGGKPLLGLSSKANELLCYLLLHRERGHAREALAGLFWPDTPDHLAKKYLRQAIWRLQSKLASRELLIVQAGWVRINSAADAWLDIAEFEQVYDFHRDLRGQELTDRQAQALETAVVLYRGDLIEPWYQDWCVYERDRLQLIYLTMLEQLMAHCEARRSYAKGVAYGQRIMRYDPARECTHRILMRLYYQAGDRTAALRQYERCAAAMAKQFNVHPSHETVALLRQVRGDHLETSATGTTVTTRSGAEQGSDLLLRVQASLEHVQAALTALQRQSQQQAAPVSRMQSAQPARPARRENGQYTGIAGRQEAR